MFSRAETSLAVRFLALKEDGLSVVVDVTVTKRLFQSVF